MTPEEIAAEIVDFYVCDSVERPHAREMARLRITLAIREAVRAEREACAQVAESLKSKYIDWGTETQTATAEYIAEAIRVRSSA